MSLKAKLRAATVGSRKQFRSELFVVRDPEKPRVEEQLLDEQGKPVLEPELDGKGKPVLDDEGKPVMRPRMVLRHPPLLDEAGKPVCIEVRQPSVNARSAIIRAAKATSAARGDLDKVEIGALQVEAIIRLCFVPGTNEPVYTEADREGLLSQPTGSWVDDLGELALKMMNVDAEEVEKNFSGTPTD